MTALQNKVHHNNHIKMDRASRIYTACVYVLVTLITLVLLYPLYFCVIASFSDPDAVAMGDTVLWFKGFSLDAYKMVMKEKQLWVGYRNSLIYMVFGTIYDVALTIPAAYVCSKTKIPGHKVIMWFFLLTMYFGGGLIPTYLWYKDLGLVNNPLVMIIGSGVNAYYLIVSRTYFTTSIPPTLYEAAEIDGANEFKKFFRIALPLAKPIIAVIALYYAFAKWNSYYTALIYLKNQKYWPLQLVLRQILIANENALSALGKARDAQLAAVVTYKLYIVRAMKYAIILIASLPMLILYPFVSKYFMQGTMVGSVKE